MPARPRRQRAGAASSTGGSAGIAGVDFDALTFAWLTSHMVSDTALPETWRLADGRLTSAGGQTGAEMDDGGAITRQAGRVYVQAKGRLNLGDTKTSPLAEAIDQAARQFRDGVIENGGRRLEEHRDLLGDRDRPPSAQDREGRSRRGGPSTVLATRRASTRVHRRSQHSAIEGPQHAAQALPSRSRCGIRGRKRRRGESSIVLSRSLRRRARTRAIRVGANQRRAPPRFCPR